MMRAMGGLADKGGVGSGGDMKPNFDDLDLEGGAEEQDSDDDDIPELE